MKTRKVNEPVKELSLDEKKNIEVERIFEQITNSARELLTVFEIEKYRTTVLVEHSKIGRYENLIREFLSYHWNFTMSKNKQGGCVIYFGYDGEAISKFGNRLYNEMLRKLIALTMKEATSVNIEDRIRVNHEPTDIHNFYYKRVMDGKTEHVTIQVQDLKTA